MNLFNESLNVEDAKDPVCYVKGIEFVRDRSTIKDSKAQNFSNLTIKNQYYYL